MRSIDYFVFKLMNIKEEPPLLFHDKTKEETLNALSTNREGGLTAAQVAELQQKHGPNRLREKKKKTLAQRFFDQFKDVMILILIAAAIVSFVIVCVEKNWGELFEPGLILLIVLLNAAMGVYQEGKAEKALEALNCIKNYNKHYKRRFKKFAPVFFNTNNCERHYCRRYKY